MYRFAAITLLALAACSQPEAAEPPEAESGVRSESAATETVAPDAPSSSYEWTASFDPAGYYLPAANDTANGWVVDHLFLPAGWMFEQWRQEGSDPQAVPVWIEAYPVGVEPQINEQGREYYPDSVRVRPDRLTLADGAFEFAAAGSPMGNVLISGQIQSEYLQGDAMQPHSEPALVGGMEIGGERLRNVSFTHWHGD